MFPILISGVFRFTVISRLASAVITFQKGKIDMAKTKASGASGLSKSFQSKVGNRLVVTMGNKKLTYTFAGNGELIDELDDHYKIKDIPGGINGIAKRADKIEVLPPKESRWQDVETRISKEATRATRLYRKSKASGARHFSR